MDILSDILSLLKLQGTLYFRTSFTSPWGVTVPAFEHVARFHFVHRGRCFAHVDGVDAPVPMEQGDLVIITRGAGHTLCCDVKNKAGTPLEQVVRESGFDGTGVLVYGDPDSDLETQLICGHCAFDAEARHPLLDAVPPVIHIRNNGDATQSWLESTLRVIGAEAGRGEPGGDLITIKLTEIIFAQALRTYLSTQGKDRTVFAAIANPQIRRALTAIHADPARSWSVDALAQEAGLSRTSFAGQFKALMSQTPHSYITAWRMQLARGLLVETVLPMIEIAERSGYGSEAAFSRVFKKQFGVPPAKYRRDRAGGNPSRPADTGSVRERLPEPQRTGLLSRTWERVRELSSGAPADGADRRA